MPNVPGVYTDVSKFLSWVRSNVEISNDTKQKQETKQTTEKEVETTTSTTTVATKSKTTVASNLLVSVDPETSSNEFETISCQQALKLLAFLLFCLFL